jgi:mRNA-degrading endonuclease RelE of RelBE toxin-antitoxin system
MFEIIFAEGVAEDLEALTAYYRSIVLDRIDEQLIYQPTIETRAKKKVIGLRPPWHYEEPIWELRVGEFRVFSDVDEPNLRVTVRAIRRKPPHITTKEIT